MFRFFYKYIDITPNAVIIATKSSPYPATGIESAIKSIGAIK
nr:hypothetical protein [Clostridium perfringens]